MKTKNCNFVTKRRGLSSIVGALIFVVLMVATFAVLGVALDSQTDIVDVSRDVANLGLKKQQEAFQINDVRQDPGQSLKVETINKGQNPTEIFTMVITNSSDIANGYPTNTFDIPYDNSLLPPGHSDPINVAETLDLKMKLPSPSETDTYNIKLVSSLGTIQKYKIECKDISGDSVCGPGVDPTGPGGLAAQLFLDGPNGVNTKTTTVVMFVTNTGDVTLSNVKPDFGYPTPDCDDMWTVAPTGGLEDISPCDLDTLTVPTTLVPGQTYLFKWDGKVAGDINDQFTFCNRASGDEPDATLVTTSITCDTMTVIDPNDCGGCEGGGEGGETIILIDDLLIRPSIFMIIPSPMGDAEITPAANKDPVLFGANVVNPTNSTIKVSKLLMSVYAPGANNNDKLFQMANNDLLKCEPINIQPSGTNDWSCPGENVIMWKNRDNPIVLNPYSNQQFLVKVLIGEAGRDLEGVLIQTSVFTTAGSFGKGDYQTTMRSDIASTMSVYLSPVPETTTLSDANIQSDRQNIVHDEPQTFNLVLADTDTNELTWLEIGAKFVINVPREWTDVNVTSNVGFFNNYTVTEHGDGSTQVIAETNKEIGKCTDTCSGSEVRASTITIEALPPNKEFDRLYVMYVLADGEVFKASSTPSLFSSGPLNEIILQVNSNSTGP